MEFRLIFFLFVASIPVILAQDINHGTIVVDGTTTVAQTDDNFVCATIDWWPHDKCNYQQCPWHYTSALNLVRLKINCHLRKIKWFFCLIFSACSVKLLEMLKQFTNDAEFCINFFYRTCLILSLPKLSKVCISTSVTMQLPLDFTSKLSFFLSPQSMILLYVLDIVSFQPFEDKTWGLFARFSVV